MLLRQPLGVRAYTPKSENLSLTFMLSTEVKKLLSRQDTKLAKKDIFSCFFEPRRLYVFARHGVCDFFLESEFQAFG
jgi:hypothetical protein